MFSLLLLLSIAYNHDCWLYNIYVQSEFLIENELRSVRNLKNVEKTWHRYYIIIYKTKSQNITLQSLRDLILSNEVENK